VHPASARASGPLSFQQVRVTLKEVLPFQLLVKRDVEVVAHLLVDLPQLLPVVHPMKHCATQKTSSKLPGLLARHGISGDPASSMNAMVV
jgi:hypothetical protein